MSPQSSHSTCRHAPQGVIGSSAVDTIAISSNSFVPDAMAEKTATLSAQMVRPKDAVSMLHPVYVFPSLPFNAAPTISFENGALLAAMAFLAASSKSLLDTKSYLLCKANAGAGAPDSDDVYHCGTEVCEALPKAEIDTGHELTPTDHHGDVFT
jgi:hypothetical protein